MRVLVTGSRGFIGRNLVSHLTERDDVEVIEYDRDTDYSVIEDNLAGLGCIVHLAGVNRPETTEEFYTGNVGSIEQIIAGLRERKLEIPVILTSSVHAATDSDYGKSKKAAEDVVLEYGNKSVVYRLNNVFGKWCRPNYNSAVATFCDSIANGKEFTVNDRETEIELVYIDDVVSDIIRVIDGGEPSERDGGYCYVRPSYKVTLGRIVDLLQTFQDKLHTPFVPETGDDFVKKLYSTFLSYVPLDKLSSELKMNVDERGWFVELVKTDGAGQFSASSSDSGVIRGNHYHHTKIEKFMVVKGAARICLRHIVDGTMHEFKVSDAKIESVIVPPGYTHSIENIGNGEMILMIWCNEVFGQQNTDTFFAKVKEDEK